MGVSSLLLVSQVRIELMDADGYEVEGEKGNFVCAFSKPEAAIQFALKLQENLMTVNWSSDVLATKYACEQFGMDGSRIHCGPRTAIGMSTMNASRVQTCERTGRMEYFGPVMNHSARVAMAAHGGQVSLKYMPD
jgi:adenylate cyclase